MRTEYICISYTPLHNFFCIFIKEEILFFVSFKDHWETQQLKAKLTVQQKYLEEEQKLHHYQIEKEKEKLKMAQASIF